MIENKIIFYLIASVTALITCYLIIKTECLHGHISGDIFINGPQKVHHISVSRIGGLAIIFGIVVSLYLQQNFASNELSFLAIISSLPAFLIGFLEDLTKKICPTFRILAIALSAFFAIIFLKIVIYNTDIIIIDWLLKFPIIAFIFTMFAITGLTNSYNIIDGLNGLSCMVAIFALTSISLTLSNYNNLEALNFCLILIGSIIGFLAWNYPKGSIFLGDGGAYLIGFLISVFSVYTVTIDKTISPWFAISINSYPVIETIFSIYRRHFKDNKNPSVADALHLHSLIYKYIAKRSKSEKLTFRENAKSSLYIFSFTIFSGFPALFCPNSTIILALWFFISLLIYILVYKHLINILKK